MANTMLSGMSVGGRAIGPDESPARRWSATRRDKGGRIWRRFVPVAVLLLATLLPTLAVAAAADPATVVQRFLDARNRGDVAAAAAAMTDDIVFVGGANCPATNPCVGIATAREQVRLFYSDHAQATVVGALQVSGATVRGRLEVRADASRAAGVERFLVDLTVELRGDKLASHRSIPDASDPQTAQYLAYLRAQQGRASVAVVERLLAALNAGDLDAALALVADDATIRYAPPEYGPRNGCCTGKAAVRMAYGNLIAGQGQFAPTQPLQGAGDTVTGRIRQTGPGVRATGLAFIDADNTFTIRDGLLAAQVVAFTPETIAAGFKGVGTSPPGLPNTGGGAARRGNGTWVLLIAGLGLAGTITLVGRRTRGRRGD